MFLFNLKKKGEIPKKNKKKKKKKNKREKKEKHALRNPLFTNLVLANFELTSKNDDRSSENRNLPVFSDFFTELQSSISYA